MELLILSAELLGLVMRWIKECLKTYIDYVAR